MKNNILFITSTFIFLCIQQTKASPAVCDDTKTSSRVHKNFKRSYRSLKNAISSEKTKNNTKRSTLIEITQEDFSEHLSLEKTRTVLVHESPFTMDIGMIDSETNETWQLPDLESLGARTVNLKHVAPEESGVLNYFPEDATHAIYSELVDVYEIYSLNEFDLFFYGYGEIEDGERVGIDYWATMAPVPLKLGESYEGIVTFINDGDSSEPLDSIQYTDLYEVIGQGTLKTFEDGDVDAIKLAYREETREFIDGEMVYYDERDEIVFYSKEGHYVRAGIDDLEMEGLVTLNDINYQRIKGKTDVLDTSLLNLIDQKTYPNPIISGATLTIQSIIDLTNRNIIIYNIQGQKLNTIPLKNSNKSNQYTIQIPVDLAGGLYFYRVHNQNGEILINGKVQII